MPFGFLDFETPSLCGLLLVLLFLIPDLFAACLEACLFFTVDVRDGAIVWFALSVEDIRIEYYLLSQGNIS